MMNQNCNDLREIPTTAKTCIRARLRACRSFLLTPASQPEIIPTVRAASGDGIMIDLESTVAPADKARAREAAMDFLQTPKEQNFIRLLRINSPHTVEGLRDLLALHESGACPDAVVIPKCTSAADVQLVADVLSNAQSTIGIVPMMELARAVFAVEQIAQAHECVCGLFLGGGDLAADLGAVGTWWNLLYARSCMVAAAATTNIAAIDVPYFKPDLAGLEREATASRDLGMTGKAALHTEQLAAINSIFTPPPEAIAHARAVMTARAVDPHTPVLNGHVLECAMLREAERVLAIAARLTDVAG